LTVGPLSVCVDAGNWQTYNGMGILASCGKSPNHCVQIVGVDTKNKFWKVYFVFSPYIDIIQNAILSNRILFRFVIVGGPNGETEATCT